MRIPPAAAQGSSPGTLHYVEIVRDVPLFWILTALLGVLAVAALMVVVLVRRARRGTLRH